MTTLVLILTVAGFTDYTVLSTSDQETCDRWGQVSVEAGEASSYLCLPPKTGKA